MNELKHELNESEAPRLLCSAAAAAADVLYQRPTNLLGMIHESREDANEEVRLSAILRGHLRVILTPPHATNMGDLSSSMFGASKSKL